MPPLRRLTTLIASLALLAALAPATARASTVDTSTGPTQGPCQYTPTPDDPAVRPVSLPPDPQPTPDHGKVVVTFVTNRGLIPLQLDRAEAPCTVQSFLHLLVSGFYNDTICHRLTTYPTLSAKLPLCTTRATWPSTLPLASTFSLYSGWSGSGRRSISRLCPFGPE